MLLIHSFLIRAILTFLEGLGKVKSHPMRLPAAIQIEFPSQRVREYNSRTALDLSVRTPPSSRRTAPRPATSCKNQTRLSLSYPILICQGSISHAHAFVESGPNPDVE